MMKHLLKVSIFSILFFLQVGVTFGQQVQRESIGTLGGSAIIKNAYIQECVGQSYQAQSKNTPKALVNPGFVQPTVKAVVLAEEKLIFNFYPNPVKEFLNIDWTEQFNKTTIRVYNVQGIIIQIMEVRESSFAELNLEHIPSGMYIIEVQQNNSINRTSVIKI